MSFWWFVLTALTAGPAGQAVFMTACLLVFGLFPAGRDHAAMAGPAAHPPVVAGERPAPDHAGTVAPVGASAVADSWAGDIAAKLAEERPGLAPGQRAAIAAAIGREAGRQGVDPWLIFAVIWVESDFDPLSLGGAGERGLMQILPATARSVAASRFGEPHLDPDRLFEPEVNVRLGTAHLAELLETHGGDPARALTAYNTGRARGAPNGYARRVLSRLQAVRPAPARSLAGLGGKAPPAVEPFRS